MTDNLPGLGGPGDLREHRPHGSKHLRGDGTVLPHDSDCTSGSRRATLAALPTLVDGWRPRGRQVGTLREHTSCLHERQDVGTKAG